MPKFLFNKPSLKILQAPQLNNLFPLKSPRKIEKLVKNVAFFLSSLLLVFVFSSVFVPNCRAQSFASWLEEFLRQNQAPPQEQSPQEALAVAHEKSQAARETLEKYRSQEFAESFRQASIPESRLSELITAKQEEVQTWESAIANIRELNNLLATPEPTPQQAPPTPQEAAELERKLDRLREFKLKLQLEKDSIQTLSEQNRQNLRFLQQELAEAQRELEGAAETTARSQAQSRQELAFAKIGAAEAANFLYRWHIRRLERQLFLVNSEINTTNSVLEKSGLLNVLDASRAN
ncbi:MAG: hypothetical protein NZL93_03575, partial [Chthoniobacterales bacterium]|nr:hypothetical protein [Chthoniobacterales bacterium]